MGGLRPIGSEKLQGMDKIRRIMEIARYNENIPNPVNENKRTDYTAELADGNEYSIVKERQGYIIKRTLSESTIDYIEPIQNRKYFSSYSEALKKLNLMAKEFNSLYGNDEGMSLFVEQKKKFKLKLPGGKKTEETPTPEPVVEPSPIPEPTPMSAPTPEPIGGELPPPTDMPMDEPTDMPMDDEMDDEMEPPMDDEMGDEDMSDDESEDKKGPTIKTIQKLTGKLAQKIRSYNTKDEMDSNDVKYIVNSILSAIDVDVLDDEDLEEIIDRLEGNFDDEDENEGEEMEDDGIDNEMLVDEPLEPSEDDLPPPAEPEGGEMSEIMNLAQGINKATASSFTNAMKDELPEGDTTEYGIYGARKPRHQYGEIGEFKHLKHGTFGESEVDKIISQYFNINEGELINEEKLRIQKLEKEEKFKEINKKNIKKLSESIAQERGAFKFFENHPKYKLIGKTNKGNLVFKNGIIETKINLNGKPL